MPKQETLREMFQFFSLHKSLDHPKLCRAICLSFAKGRKVNDLCLFFSDPLQHFHTDLSQLQHIVSNLQASEEHCYYSFTLVLFWNYSYCLLYNLSLVILG
ncbi:hypothetical protein PAHAL_3G432400 [Panicum hallii]|uniref:Uncharacterized protein n=1 Tax=Panicum hallii TaxID=206008 RepID=A0A2S3HEE4_9POAL|nr:hypothetical protein PAHAL_3G432400 [Panicum hallii]